MPTPTGDFVTLSLQKVLSGRKEDFGDEEGLDLDKLLSIGSNKALHTNIEYELAESHFANSLSAMKSKYICFSPKPIAKKNGLSLGNIAFHNGNGVKNGCINGVKNGTNLKVNPDAVLPQPKFVMFPPENVVLGWKGKGPVGGGMINSGNTCYLNSILQALFHVPALVNFLVNDTEHRKKCEQESGPSCGDCLTCALAKTLHLSRNHDVIRPELITSKLKMICRSLCYGAEEDAHEFMRYLLENVEKGYVKRFPQKKLDTYSRETTPINQIFGGYMRQEVTCRNCGNVSTTFQHFQDLILDIRKASKLDDALDQYFSKECLDGPDAYRCEKCKQQSAATKKCSIEKPPKVLCMQLKRFTGVGTKIPKNVEIKQHISMQKYLYAPSQFHSSTRYKLIAMVNHSGATAGGGHYTAIAETPSSNFYLFDDSHVRPIQTAVNNHTNTCAYILFYEVEPPRTMNGQREISSLKATPSTITSNGNTSSNGSTYPLKKWDRIASPTQTSVQPRLILHTKKVKSPLVEKVNRLEAEPARNENRPFIGPRLPTDLKTTVNRPPETPPPLNNDENAPRKRLLDGTVKIPEERKKAKVSTSLVPYDDEDSSGSESSLSPDANQVLTVKATTPADWQVSYVRSPSVSSEGSVKMNWNVAPRTPPTQRKVNNCSSDNDTDPKTDNSLSSAASLDRTVGEKAPQDVPSVDPVVPLSPSTLLKNGFQENCLKKKNDFKSENERTPKDSRQIWKENSQNRSRTPHRSEESSSSHSSSWKNGGPSSYNGVLNRNYSFNRNNSSNSSHSAMAERGMQNGHSQTNSWGKDSSSSDAVSHLTELSHTGFSNQVRTWNGDRSNLDRSSEEEDRLSRKRRNSDYDEEMDRGRTKKQRHRKEFSSYNPFNHFQQNRHMANQKYNFSRHSFHKYNGYSNKKHHNNSYRNRNGMGRPPPYARF